ncbi:MAG: hypothetical protein LBO79_05615 [Zoogloeaceae bacterium]|jgi:hypothetical protein|nr:hypothetical protein [Zoogloeaceae bacterium]
MKNPQPDTLEKLSARLAQTLDGRPRQLAWGDPQAMRRSLEAARLTFGGRRGMMTREARLVRSILAVRLQGRAASFVQLKYACLGLAQPVDWEARRLLDEEPLCEILLRQVAALQGDPRRFAACLRGLRKARQMASAEVIPHASPCARNLERLARFFLASSPADDGIPARQPAAEA